MIDWTATAWKVAWISGIAALMVYTQYTPIPTRESAYWHPLSFPAELRGSGGVRLRISEHGEVRVVGRVTRYFGLATYDIPDTLVVKGCTLAVTELYVDDGTDCLKTGIRRWKRARVTKHAPP